ncbi:MAG: SRPBCC family protein, partial [Chakrabartia sp.]
MPRHSETRILPYSAAQMYGLVTDVARYGEFLPWVSAVRVRSDNDTEMVADLIVGFKALKESFTSRVHKTPMSAVRV